MKRSIKKISIIAISAIAVGALLQFTIRHTEYSEPAAAVNRNIPPFLEKDSGWADSLNKTLSDREKLGQMLMVPAYPKKGAEDTARIADLIRKHQVGGIIFFQGSPEEVHGLARYYQSISKIPLLIAIDGEWGLAMRLSNTIQYPKQMTLGAISSDMLIYQMGYDIASQMKHLGIHINFAPVVDVNNNPANPVINARSFGEQKNNVARKGILYMKGMQDAGVMAFAKHFPGHGDTDTDSHHDLPVVMHSAERLDSLELYPFRALINAGVSGVMLAHMHIPALDNTPNLPSTLSSAIANDLLQKEMCFEGLVVTDAMNMKGVADYFPAIEANLMAIKAGNNILLMPHQIEESIEAILKEMESDAKIKEQVNQSCQKILKAKKWAFTHAKSETYSADSLNKPKFVAQRNQLYAAALTLIQNQNDLLPFKALDTLRIASLTLGEGNSESFTQSLKLYSKIQSFSGIIATDSVQVNKLVSKLQSYNLVLISLHSNSLNAGKKFGVSDEEIQLVEKLAQANNCVLIHLANPYIISRIDELHRFKAVLLGYENSPEIQQLASEALFGAAEVVGALPVTVYPAYPAGFGMQSKTLNRLSYVTPYEAGFDEKKLATIDSIVNDAIAQGAIPGCQVLAAKNGKVFFFKAFGHHSYQKKNEVELTDLYDIASITKIAATMPALMRLQDEKLFDVSERLGYYLPELDTCAKGNLIISDILLHQAGLAPWIPFYWQTLEPIYPGQDLFKTRYSENYPLQVGPNVFANKHLKYKEHYYQTTPDSIYSVNVAEALYLNRSFTDSIWQKIAASRLDPPGTYLYSDLGFYLFPQIIQRLSGCTFEQYIDSVFFAPMGAYLLSFKPLNKYQKDQIIPTENDLVFRKQIIHGYVHDQGAALLGGVSGHAGLFSNANDLAKIMQMYLNEGAYGELELLSKRQVRSFTSCLACENGNRRGLGFDKPEPDTNLNGPVFKGISLESYGHAGFTGTLAWADPSTGIVFIFLSNRIYPDPVDNKLVKLEIRSKVHEAIYKAALN
ncbi:MAG: serine hydrolase [Bacteroidota bacterium]|nr:MAG: serine hydrolase [Bacteroidota bacterium]